MNRPLITKLVLTTEFQRLSSDQTIGASFDLSNPPGNHSITVKGPSGIETTWAEKEWHSFQGCRLYDIQVKGTADEFVTIIGTQTDGLVV